MRLHQRKALYELQHDMVLARNSTCTQNSLPFMKEYFRPDSFQRISQTFSNVESNFLYVRSSHRSASDSKKLKVFDKLYKNTASFLRMKRELTFAFHRLLLSALPSVPFRIGNVICCFRAVRTASCMVAVLRSLFLTLGNQ